MPPTSAHHRCSVVPAANALPDRRSAVSGGDADLQASCNSPRSMSSSHRVAAPSAPSSPVVSFIVVPPVTTRRFQFNASCHAGPPNVSVSGRARSDRFIWGDRRARSAASRVRRGEPGPPSLLRVFPDTLKRRLSLLLRKLPEANPILLSRIWINLYGCRIEGIGSILLAAGDPVFFVRLYVPVIALKARDLPEPAAVVINRFARFGEG